MMYKTVFSKRIRFELFKKVFIFLAFATTLVQAQGSSTTKEFSEGSEKLVVYSDVPGLVPSEFYTIKVRSAATKNVWVECYANITRSLWSTIPIAGTGNKEHYYAYVKDWSHTYSNIEMSSGSLVEVQIAAKNGFKIKGSDFTTANAHPVQKASKPTVVDNIVYFTIDNPGQITIDINGQMDETNTGNGYSGPAIHTVSLFANPIMQKPSLTDPNVLVVEPGVMPPSNLGSKTTLYFKPGVHDIGRGFPIFANKNYYIPGDAIVYGTLFNGASSGANIRIYGYGTLSGDRIKHYLYDIDSDAVPGGLALDDKSWKLIWSVQSSNFRIEGVSLMNCPKHTANVGVTGANKATQTSARWIKIVTWRSNGDGIGSIDEISDSFIRTQDDCTYVKGDRLRTVFWTDVNGSVFSMAGMDWAIRPIVVEDCDIIYPRHNSLTWDGGRVFAKRGEQAAGDKVTTALDITFRNIRITDPFQTLETFYITSINKNNETSGGYGGIKFQNITSVRVPLATHNRIIGQPTGIWNDITFDNVVLGGKKILSRSDFAAMAEPYVTNVKFLPTLAVADFGKTKSNQVHIYTDGSSKQLVVSSTETEIKSIQLIDITGRVIYSDDVAKNNRSVDLSSFSSGMIVVKVVCNSGTYTQKILNN